MSSTPPAPAPVKRTTSPGSARCTRMGSVGLVTALLLAALPSGAAAQEPPRPPMMTDGQAAAETIRLWEGDAPGALGQAEHDIPTLAWWPARSAKQPAAALIVCPGGGYGALADHEGSDYARWLNTLGVSAFVLRYRLGSKGYRHPVMLGDATRAIRLVRRQHERLGIDPERVGVMGSSAGGHLALSLCIHGAAGDAAAADPIDRESARPALGVLCYPVVSMMPGSTHAGSRKNLLGDQPDEEVARSLSGELAADERTPPLFLWHTEEDKGVKLEPVVALALRMRSLHRPYELHVYETGPHGIGLGVRPYTAAKTLHPWTLECSRWLGAHGFLPNP